MKRKIIIFGTVLFFTAFSNITNAQATATATATATVVAPIAITKTADMSFGNVAATGLPGTVILTPLGIRTGTGGITLPTTDAGTLTAASFDITGQGVYVYTITLPNSHTITHTNATDTMTIDTFISVPALVGTLIAGAQTLDVGATLNIGADQEAGVYTSTTAFDVVINYN